jgi:hypothetical protein
VLIPHTALTGGDILVAIDRRIFDIPPEERLQARTSHLTAWGHQTIGSGQIGLCVEAGGPHLSSLGGYVAHNFVGGAGLLIFVEQLESSHEGCGRGCCHGSNGGLCSPVFGRLRFRLLSSRTKCHSLGRDEIYFWQFFSYATEPRRRLARRPQIKEEMVRKR